MPATSARDWALSFSAAVLLVAVATLQQYRTLVSDQSWWGAGAGFGMYATVDYHGSRTLRITIHTDTGAQRVAVESDSAWRARVLPTQSNIEALADELLQATWRVATNVAPDEPRYTRATPADDSDRVSVHRVDVELLRWNFDAETATVTTWSSRKASAP